MKRTAILIFILISVICVLLLWRHKSHESIATNQIVGTNSDTTPTNEKEHELSKALRPASAKIKSTTTKDPRTMTPDELQSWMISDWQTPIDFYGKVVDENSNAVSGAGVQFEWDELPHGRDTKHFSTTSDTNGLFSLRGAKGPSLDVRVSKNGYYTPRPGVDSFTYSGDSHFSPDVSNPVIFKIRKMGTPEPLIRLAGPMGGDRQYRLDSKGEPTTISFYTGKRVPTGQGQFEIAFTMQGSDNGNQRQFQWDCVVSIPGGGLQAAPTEFAFSAPDTGYQPTDEIKSESDPNKWTDQFERSYYVQLADGNYGIVNLTVMCGSNPFFGVDVLVNRAGSRNLEYDKYLPGNIFVDQSSP